MNLPIQSPPVDRSLIQERAREPIRWINCDYPQPVLKVKDFTKSVRAILFAVSSLLQEVGVNLVLDDGELPQ